MALNGNNHEKFLILSEGKEGTNGKTNRLFIPEGEKAVGWW